MITWVLVFALYGNAYGMAPAVTTAEFNSQEKCIEAGKAAQQIALYQDRVKWACVKK